jgi:hypothetical protein
MPTASENASPVQGLCTTCVCYPQCERCHDEGIFYCDSYQDLSTPAWVPRTNGSPRATETRSAAERLMGLCVSCERRSYCTNARKLGGVWVCEEYL